MGLKTSGDIELQALEGREEMYGECMDIYDHIVY